MKLFNFHDTLNYKQRYELQHGMPINNIRPGEAIISAYKRHPEWPWESTEWYSDPVARGVSLSTLIYIYINNKLNMQINSQTNEIRKLRWVYFEIWGYT